MSRGGYRGRENFPHTFYHCSHCHKKGVYERVSLIRAGGMERRCKYCEHIVQVPEPIRGIIMPSRKRPDMVLEE